MNGILVNHKNLSEVWALAGLAVIAECLDSSLSQMRFTRTKTTPCADGVFRSRMFEFEHPDYVSLLTRIACLDVIEVGDTVLLRGGGKDVMTLDWFNVAPFLGDSGNFKSNCDKVNFVNTHHEAFKQLVTTDNNLFSLAVETEETNYLANVSQLKKTYQDAGGVYEPKKIWFAREFLLLVGLQNLHSMMATLVNEDKIEYCIPTQPTTLAGLFAALAGYAGEKYLAKTKSFGKDGLVLSTAVNVADVEQFVT